MEELTKRLTELAVDEAEAAINPNIDPWTIGLSPYDIIVSAMTKDRYPDEVAAWEGARSLWRAVLDLGYELADAGGSEISAQRRLDVDSGVPGWWGKVRMVLKPV